MKGGRSGVSLRAAIGGLFEDGGAPRKDGKAPPFISSRRKRSVIYNHFTELVLEITEKGMLTYYYTELTKRPICFIYI